MKYSVGDTVLVMSSDHIDHHLKLGSLATVMENTFGDCVWLRGSSELGEMINQTLDLGDIAPHCACTKEDCL